MKKILALILGATAALTASGAAAGELEDVNARLEQLERQNAAIRKENAALRENQRLLEENSRLKSLGVHASIEPAGSAPRSRQEKTETVPASALSPRSRNPLQAYAAALPVKALPPEAPGQLRAWIEGGAIWSGGDPVFNTYIDNNNVSGVFDLTPKAGWETAIGFDHRFAGSPWHINGQFRTAKAARPTVRERSTSSLPSAQREHKRSGPRTRKLTGLLILRLGTTSPGAAGMDFSLRRVFALPNSPPGARTRMSRLSHPPASPSRNRTSTIRVRASWVRGH